MLIYQEKVGDTVIDIKKILYWFDDRNFELCDDISQKILDNLEIKDYLNLEEKCASSKNDSLYRFKRRIYGLSVQNVLFSLLEENNYNINYEAKEFMRMNHLKNRISGQLYENDIINMFLCSPYIEEIGSSKKGSFIRLKDVGDFSLGYADYKFRKNRTINEYINNERLMSGCHRHVEFLVEHYPELYSITSLTGHLYNGFSFYHSYCYDEKKDMVIDLTLNLVMKKEDYDKLFKSEELFVIPGKSLSKAAHIAFYYNQDILDYFTPLASTLFQQYIWENNLASPDKSIFSEEPSNKKLLMKNRLK